MKKKLPRTPVPQKPPKVETSKKKYTRKRDWTDEELDEQLRRHWDEDYSEEEDEVS